MVPIFTLPRWLKAPFVWVALGVLGAGMWFYQQQRQLFEARIEKELQAVAQLKANQIAQWRGERLADAAVLQETPFLSDAVAQWLANPQDVLTEKLLSLFRSLQQHLHYNDVLLVDPEGRVRLSLTGYQGVWQEAVHHHQPLADAWRTGRPVLSLLHRSPDDSLPHIIVVAPLYSSAGASRPLGAIILESKASKFLYPLIQSWPTPSQSAEMLLVRREGDSVLFVNDLRYRPDTALKFRQPLSQETAASRTIQGEQGLFRELDYRGVPVLAAGTAVPGSPWFLIAKVDQSEALSAWNTLSSLSLSLMATLLVALALTALWQYQRKAAYRALFHTEAALHDREAEFRVMFERSSVGMAQADLEGRLLRVNATFAQLSGYPAVELIGKSFLELTPADDRSSNWDDFTRLIEGEIPAYLGEKRFVRPDGSIGWAHVTANLMRDAEGRPLRIIAVTQDITTRRTAEQQVSRLAAVVEQAGDSIVITDPEGCIVYVNPCFEQVTGYSAAEVIGRDPRILKSGHQNVLFYRQLWDTINAGHIWRGQFVNRRKDGNLFHEEATLFPIQDAHGRILNYAAVKKDVTLRIHADAKIRKLTQMYATLSHTNEVIVRAISPDELFRQLCQGAVERGQFTLAWVGLVDEATRTVRPHCYAGREQGYLTDIRVSIDDVPEGQGPIGMAIREAQVSYVNDYAMDERMLPWRDAALHRGFRGAAAVPFQQEEGIRGAVALYVEEPDFFDGDQLHLLMEMSKDISFALDGFVRNSHRVRAEAEREAALHQLRKTLDDTIRMAASTIELRDPYTAGHQQRVAQLATAIAHKLGLSKSQTTGIHFGSLIHDLGKIYVPAEILSKPRKLTDLEMGMIHTHAQAGYEIVKNVDFPWPVAQMIWQHHERWDGSGYPQGLKAEEILLEARILAVADVMEAMSSHRPYRPGLGIELALAEIREGSGVRYDPRVAEACLRLFQQDHFAFVP